MNRISNDQKSHSKGNVLRTERKIANGKYAKDWKLELLALSGFCVSGVIFIVSGVQSGDFLTVLGSIVWIVSCLCWMIPYRRFF
jgi:hypothetical protein